MPTRRFVLALAPAALAGLALPALACDTPGDLAAIQAGVVAAVNARRRREGLRALAASPGLMTAAQRHACDNAGRNTMSHRGSNGSSPGDRARAAGYRWRAMSENVAYGRHSADSVVDAWMNSPPHRRNILKGGHSDAGVGVAVGPGGTPQWVLVMATPR